MTDEELANLLGARPATPDLAFRIDVFARVAQHKQRRAARTRALNIVAASSGVGAFFGLAQAAGFNTETAQPLFYALVAVGAAYLLAMEAVKGRRSPFARAVSQLRFRL
jgi:uncharacterized membrane protein YfcA